MPGAVHLVTLKTSQLLQLMHHLATPAATVSYRYALHSPALVARGTAE
jgi:hypothetical protein